MQNNQKFNFIMKVIMSTSYSPFITTNDSLFFNISFNKGLRDCFISWDYFPQEIQKSLENRKANLYDDMKAVL